VDIPNDMKLLALTSWLSGEGWPHESYCSLERTDELGAWGWRQGSFRFPDADDCPSAAIRMGRQLGWIPFWKWPALHKEDTHQPTA
jgi:hypothetical protein